MQTMSWGISRGCEGLTRFQRLHRLWCKSRNPPQRHRGTEMGTGKAKGESQTEKRTTRQRERVSTARLAAVLLLENAANRSGLAATTLDRCTSRRGQKAQRMRR